MVVQNGLVFFNYFESFYYYYCLCVCFIFTFFFVCNFDSFFGFNVLLFLPST